MPLRSAERKPWVAAILTLLIPGLGQIYAGAGGRGWLVLLLWSALVAAILKVVVMFPSVWAPFLLVIGILIALGATMVDAARIARRAPRPFVPAPYNRWYVYVILICVWPIISAPIRHIMRRQYEAFKIPTASMQPTIDAGDYLFTRPWQGAVDRDVNVVFEHEGKDFIKRVVGIAGDTLAMRHDSLYRNGRYVPEPYTMLTDSGAVPPSDGPSRLTWGPIIVPPNDCFVLGDNRDASLDSRYFGFVSLDSIRRRPLGVYLSIDPKTHAVRWSRIGRDVSR